MFYILYNGRDMKARDNVYFIFLESSILYSGTMFGWSKLEKLNN